MFNWKRLHKDGMRKIAAAKVLKILYNVILMLPGHSCLCLKELLSSNAISRKTFVIVAEYDKKNIANIKRFLKKNFDNYYIHVGKVETLKLRKVLDGRKINFTFLDTCNTLNAHIAGWLHLNQDCFSDDCRAAFTFSNNLRGPNFANKVWKAVKKDLTTEVKDVLKSAKTNILTLVNQPKVLPALQFTCQTLHLIFDTLHTEFEQVYHYKDTRTPMSLIIMNFSGRKESERDIIREVILKFNENSCPCGRVPGYTPRKVSKYRGRPTKKTYKSYSFNFYAAVGRPNHYHLTTKPIIRQLKKLAKEHGRPYSNVIAGCRAGATKQKKALTK